MAEESRRVVIAALCGNLMIALSKFVVAVLSGSAAMMSEAIHSTVDTGNQGLLLYGMHRASRPADREFPFGYGKEVFFWSFVVAILLFSFGAGVSMYQGVRHLVHPDSLEDAYLNYVVLAIAVVFEGASWFIAVREFRRRKGNAGYLRALHRAKDPNVFVVLFEDSAALIGIVVAFTGVGLSQLTGNPLFDGAASVVIGLLLALAAGWLALETKGLLIGESARPQVVDRIRRIAGGYEEISEVHQVLTMHLGPHDILVNLGIAFHEHSSAESIIDVIAKLDTVLKEEFADVRRVFIEAEPRHSGGGPNSQSPTDSLNQITR